MIHRNINYKGELKHNTWRKIAINTWKPDYSGKILSRVEINPEPAMNYLSKINESCQEKVTLTHYLGCVMGRLQKEFPLLRSTVRGKRIFTRENCDVFFHVSRVNAKGEEDLSGKVIRKINTLTPSEEASLLNIEGRVIKNN